MDADQVKDFEAMMAGKKDEDNSEFIEPEAPPLEDLGDISELVDDTPIVDSKVVEDTVDDTVANDDATPTEDVPTAADEEMVRFAVETYGIDPVDAAALQKSNLLVTALRNTAAKQSPKEEAPPEEEKDLLDGVDMDDFDPEVAKILTGLNDRVKAGELKNKEVTAALAAIHEEELLKSQGEQEAEFDSMIEGVEGFDEILGEGGTIALPQNSKHFRNRESLWHYILVAKEVREKRNLPSLSVKVEMQQALASVFPERQKELSDQAARDEINEKLKTRATALTVKPTGVPGEEIPDGDEKALRAVKDLHAELNGS